MLRKYNNEQNFIDITLMLCLGRQQDSSVVFLSPSLQHFTTYSALSYMVRIRTEFIDAQYSQLEQFFEEILSNLIDLQNDMITTICLKWYVNYKMSEKTSTLIDVQKDK